MQKGFRVGLLIGIFAISLALFENSQNGRYQYSIGEGHGIVTDTRTGEYWTEDGSHFEPRMARITVHHPVVDDESAGDDRAQQFSVCLSNQVKTPHECVMEFRPGTSGPSSSSVSPAPQQ